MRILFAVALFLLPVFCRAQGSADGASRVPDVARWARARDYLSGRLALEAIRSKVRTDTAIRQRFARVEPVLVSATPEAPLSPAALDGALKDFARVRQVVVEPLSRIDLHGFAGSADGSRRLVDTAFAIVGKGYTLDASLKAGLEAVVGKYLAVAPDTVVRVKPVIALGGRPDSIAVSGARGRGFDFWVLLPILLLAVVCVVLWRKYVEIKEELRARKVELRSFNENYFAGGAAPRGGGASPGGSGVDRKAVERAIADSNVIAELNQAISRLQVRISQLEGKGTTTAPAAAPVVAAKVKQKPADPRPVDGADVFYMAGPVSNYFPNSAKSFTKDNTVYRFKLSANKQEAEFELHTSGAPINEIVQLAESYIKAACDEENLPSYPVRNIVTRRAGKAVLDGDKWMIKSKALIRYE